MIEYLRIRNLALIADAELEFAPGMNVLSGETGAGKSFIMKAINFILGERLSANMVRPGKDRAQVEAMFSLPDGNLVLRRELLGESGRSRFYVNDNLSSQDTVRTLRERLVTHTSQHGQQRLLQAGYQGEMVDRWMRRPELLETRDSHAKALRAALARKEALLTRSRELTERRELLELHLKTIEKVDPQPGEEEELEAQRQTLKAGAVLKRHYEQAMLVLRGNDGPGILDQLVQLEREIEQLVPLVPDLAVYEEPLAGMRETLAELERQVRRPPVPRLESGLSADDIESRLYELAQLKRKLHRTLPEILTMRQEIEENLSFLDACGLDIMRAEKEEQAARKTLQAALDVLNVARREAATVFCTALESELAGLGFSEQVRVLPQFSPHEMLPGCMEDRVRLLWAPNPGQHPQPLDRIASGGELSRFLLAVVSLQAEEDEATLIFDEVDAGVGGLTLNRVADRLSDLADRRQMLLITHWPQLATRAVRHFQISKTVENNETFTRCVLLDDAGRDAELARMAGIELDCEADA